jgi:PAS domain S-box-containing protein
MMRNNRSVDPRLKKQTKFMADLIQHVSQPMIVTSADRRLLHWNAAFSKLTGYNNKELSDPIVTASLTAPEWHDSERKAFEKLQRTGKSQIFQKEYIRKDGSRVPVEVLVYEISEDGDREKYYVGLITDISDRKRLEEKLQKSESHYRTLVDNAIEGIVVTQEEKIKFVNPIVSLSIGYSQEELLSMSLNDFLCPDNENTAVESISSTAGPGTVLVVPALKVRAKGGEMRLIECTIISVIWDDKPANLNLIHDVTEHYQSEQAMRQSESKYRSILEDIEEGYYETDLEGNYTFFNDVICNKLGYSREELMGMNYQVHTDPKDVQKISDAYLEVYRTGKPLKWYSPAQIRKDGTLLFAEDSVSLLHNEKGEIIGFRGISHDITQRKQMEEALRRSEERYRTIMDEIHDDYYENDLAGNYTFVNDAFCRSLGYTMKELIGKNFRDIRPPEEYQKINEAYNKLYRTGEPIKDLHFTFIRKDGSRGFAETSAFPLRNEKGETVGFRGVSRDITVRKQAEEALKQSEEKYRTVLENVAESYYEVDVAGKFTFFNDSLCRVLGYSKEELMGRSYKTFTPPEMVEKVFQAYHHVYTTDEPITGFPMEQIRKDGKRLILENSVFPIRNEKGEIVGFRGVGRDVTERIQMEEALRKSEERYRSILEEMQDSYYETDLAGNYTFVNDAVCHGLGYTRDELIGKSFKLSYSDDEVKKLYKVFHQIYLTGQPSGDIIYTFITREGRDRIAELSAFAIRNDKGEIVGFRGVSHDITERVTMEEALRKSEERYRTLLEEMEEPYYEMDLAGNYTFFNDAVCKILGYTREEMKGITYKDYTIPEDIDRIFKIYNHIYRTGESVKWFPSRQFKKDGTPVSTETSAFPLRDKEGKIIGFRAVTRDVTEHEKMEAALRRSEERYRSVLEDMQDSYFENDLAGNYTFVNASICNILGYTFDELIGKNYKLATTSDDAKRQFAAFHQIYLTGRPIKDFRYTFVTRDGKHGTAELSALPIRNDRGEIVGFRGLSRDITERMMMEEALRESEERYGTVLEDMHEGYYELDLPGNYTFCNEALCRQLGYSKEELIGMNYRVYTPPEMVKEVFQAYNLVYRTGEPLSSFPIERIKKDGTRVFAETSVFPMRNEKGEIIGFKGVINDITARKKAEVERKQLEQKAQLASRLASVGELASGVAHEINNPLTGVIGYAHLLLARKDISRDVRRDLEIINEGSQRVAGIVKKLLAFARQTRPEQRYVNINELIHNTLDLRAYELSANNIKVTLQLTRDMPMTIADPGQLQQVFLNLIINAETEMKLANDKGKLSIKTETMNNAIKISFKDNGPGISKENLETIFDPFFTTREVGQGTGLGLSVCHGIITEHKGKIWAESEPGKGATFIIELPLITEEGQIQPAEPATEEPAKVTKAKILVVDDEPVIRQFISQVLGEEGHTVETVDNAASALKMVNNKRYRLILLDIKMPGMSGIELYKRFQKIAPSLTKRIVFVTGDVMGKRTLAFLNKTKTPYMMKPFDAKELRTEINRILAKK